METMILLLWAFDFLLGFAVLWLAWRLLACPDLFKAIVLFIAFGLFMALIWVRLSAPDVALTEAAIGAGLTGALLMAALARLRESEMVTECRIDQQDHTGTQSIDPSNHEKGVHG